MTARETTLEKHGHRSIPTQGPLGLLAVGVFGNIVLVRVTMGMAPPSFLAAALSQIFSACVWTGAVWLGAVLAYRTILVHRSCGGRRSD